LVGIKLRTDKAVGGGKIMSEERYDAAREAEGIVWEREKKYIINLKRVADFFDNLWAVSVGQLFIREREISRDDFQAELERLNPEGKWATENANGYIPKKKKKGRGSRGYDPNIP